MSREGLRHSGVRRRHITCSFNTQRLLTITESSSATLRQRHRRLFSNRITHESTEEERDEDVEPEEEQDLVNAPDSWPPPLELPVLYLARISLK